MHRIARFPAAATTSKPPQRVDRPSFECGEIALYYEQADSRWHVPVEIRGVDAYEGLAVVMLRGHFARVPLVSLRKQSNTR